MTIQTTLIIFISSIISSFLSSISWWWASIISLPIFLLAWVSLPLSIATHKVSSMFWTPISAMNYLKWKNIDWKFLLTFALVWLIWAYFWIKAIMIIDNKILSKVIGIIILLIIIHNYRKKNLWIKEKNIISTKKEYFSYFIALIMWFYESILWSGNWVLFATLTFYTKGFDFIEALGYYFAIAFFWVTFWAILLINKWFFDIKIMLASVIWSIIWSYFGSKYAKYKGNKFIKNLFIIIWTILSIKLLLM